MQTDATFLDKRGVLFFHIMTRGNRRDRRNINIM